MTGLLSFLVCLCIWEYAHAEWTAALLSLEKIKQFGHSEFKTDDVTMATMALEWKKTSDCDM